MDWLALRRKMPQEDKMPDRFNLLSALGTVLDGKQYDVLQHPFSKETTDGGEYVKLTDRRPSVRSNLCRVVVDDAVALLFSEGHWPGIKAKDQRTTDALSALAKESVLNDVMLRAATRGAVGSVAIQMRVLEGRTFYTVLETAALTPIWQPMAPDTLEQVVERRIVLGRDLAAQGYAIRGEDYEGRYWFERRWDSNYETWFLPVSINASGRDAEPVVDTERTVAHALGFVPIIWVRNLPGGEGPDGECTFDKAIDTVIEIDYLMSQGGRGLKYASDPKLVIKNQNGVESAPVGGAANYLSLSPDGDAKLLEINGNAALAIIQQVQELRASALEQMHGNRAHADKLSVATSGRSLEMMMAGLIWLADRLRTSYGEGALLSLLRMVCKASQVMEGGILIQGVAYKDLDADDLQLAWAPWMPPMPDDKMKMAQALVTAVDGKILSQETAANRYGALVDVDDASAEWARIQADMKVAADAAASIAQATATRAAANAGPIETRHLTA